MADNSVINFMQGNQLLITDSEGNVAAGLAGLEQPLWVGASTPNEAPFNVSIDGLLTATNADIEGSFLAKSGNKSIQIDPESGQILITDSTVAKDMVIGSDNYSTMDSLFGASASSTSWTLYAAASGSKTLSSSTAKVRVSSGTKNISSQAQVTLSGSLAVTCTAKKVTNDDGTQIMGSAKGDVAIYVRVYDSTSKTNTLFEKKVSSVTWTATCDGSSSSVSNTESKTVTFTDTRVTVPAGYAYVEVEYLSSQTSGSSVVCAWGTSAGTTNTASYVTQVYVSRYFANGFCLGRSSTNYVAAFSDDSDDMNFIAQNPSYGFKVTSSGIFYRKGTGSWTSLI
jgi:hypothetical protein